MIVGSLLVMTIEPMKLLKIFTKRRIAQENSRFSGATLGSTDHAPVYPPSSLWQGGIVALPGVISGPSSFYQLRPSPRQDESLQNHETKEYHTEGADNRSPSREVPTVGEVAPSQAHTGAHQPTRQKAHPNTAAKQ